MARTRWEPPFHAAVPRIGDPGATFSMVDARGIRHSITLDADGYLWPTTSDQVRLADQFGIPVAADWTFPRDPDPATPAAASPETDDEPDDQDARRCDDGRSSESSPSALWTTPDG